ncbi:hypothetical protein CLF_110393 [Clonorchis sinensis]|uniref:Uncharacterized protein n=1 Tax=Clonorchis sinensis TaxID=79923 RepID=G7YKM3_CLOSI|nr:hypothetical protein CLF_110393 [Clonorchis sinensis]
MRTRVHNGKRRHPFCDRKKLASCKRMSNARKQRGQNNRSAGCLFDGSDTQISPPPSIIISIVGTNKFGTMFSKRGGIATLVAGFWRSSSENITRKPVFRKPIEEPGRIPVFTTSTVGTIAVATYSDSYSSDQSPDISSISKWQLIVHCRFYRGNLTSTWSYIRCKCFEVMTYPPSTSPPMPLSKCQQPEDAVVTSITVEPEVSTMLVTIIRAIPVTSAMNRDATARGPLVHHTHWPAVCSDKQLRPFYPCRSSLSEVEVSILFVERVYVPPGHPEPWYPHVAVLFANFPWAKQKFYAVEKFSANIIECSCYVIIAPSFQFHEIYVRQSFSCSILSVPNCHATRRNHEGWDTARLPKFRQKKSKGRGRIRTMDLPEAPVTSTYVLTLAVANVLKVDKYDQVKARIEGNSIEKQAIKTLYHHNLVCVNIKTFESIRNSQHGSPERGGLFNKPDGNHNNSSRKLGDCAYLMSRKKGRTGGFTDMLNCTGTNQIREDVLRCGMWRLEEICFPKRFPSDCVNLVDDPLSSHFRPPRLLDRNGTSNHILLNKL